MKLEINIDEKVIKLQDNCTINNLVKTLKKMFPETWKEFTIDSTVKNVYHSWPYYIWHNSTWYTNPMTTYTFGSTAGNSGINYNFTTTNGNSTDAYTLTNNVSLNVAEATETKMPTSGTFVVDIQE